MAVIVIRSRRFRSPYRRRSGSTGTVAVVAAFAALASGAGVKAAAHGHAGAATSTVKAAPVPGGTEAAFIAAVLSDLGAPDTTSNQRSMAAWGAREGCWGCVGANNQWDSTLYEPGATAFNTFDGNLHVWNYPTAAEGAQATAATLGGYPAITAALRSGSGVCGTGFAAEFSRWSGGGYQEVC